MRVTAHVLRDIRRPLPTCAAGLGWRDFTSDADWRRNLVSTTSLLWHPGRHRLVCGLTAFDTDIMYEFDPAEGRFHSLNYPAVSEPFEIKIHRSLCLASDGSVYGATACLHREDQRMEAPGGRIFRYDFERRAYDFLGIPVPHDYIQTITLDEKRGLIYGVTYPVFNFFAFDLRRRETRCVHYVGSAPHVMALDDAGGVWSTWSPRTHSLFRYDPDTNRVHFFQHGIPGGAAGANLMYPGAGPIDMMLNGGDGFLYVGVTTGEIVRIRPETGETEYLGKPAPETRIPALAVGSDGRLWGICGFRGRCRLFAYDRAARTFEDLGHIADSRTGLPIFIAHDMVFASKGTLFVGETDTTDRSGYLWEIDL